MFLLSEDILSRWARQDSDNHIGIAEVPARCSPNTY